MDEFWPVRYGTCHHANIDKIKFGRVCPFVFQVVDQESDVGRHATAYQ